VRLEVQSWSCLAVAYGSGVAVFQDYRSSSLPTYRRMEAELNRCVTDQ
jgi:hypothetical protein